MATTIEQQVALDEALVPSAQRLRIGRSNFRLPSDIQSKESTLQVVYDVLRRSPFFRAFLVADVPEIYMQEFWATATIYQHSIRFKMDTKKHIVDLESFREMLHISPRVPGQSFAELPFEEEILEFLRFLGHSAQIKTLTDVNEDLVYQVEHKNQKKSNEMYYPRFTKVIIHHLMTKKPSIPRRNRVNWHYVRDGILFSTIKVVSRHQNTQQYGAILPIELTTEDIRNTKAYKEYYACATGEAAPKPKASAKKKKDGSASSTTPQTPIATPTPTTTVVAAPRLSAAAKDERTGSKPGVPDVLSDDLDEEISWNSSDDEDVDAQGKDRDDDEANKNDESDDRQDDDDDDQDEAEKDQGLRISEEEEEADKLYHDSLSTSSFVTNLLNPIIDPGMESIFTTGSSTVTPIPSLQSIMTPSIISTFTTVSQLPTPPTPIPSLDLQSLPTFASVFCFEDRVKLLEVNFSNILGNKSIQRSDEQRNLYKALVEAYDADKTILDTYGESAILKRRREEDDDQEGPSTRSDRGSTTGTQSRQLSTSKSAFAKEPMQTTCQMEEPSHPVFETGAEDQPIVQTSQHPEWFSQPRRPPTPDRNWNKSLPAAQGNAQSWISALAKQIDARSSFNEHFDTLIDFYNFIMNRLGVDTLTPELLAGPTYELMRGSCNSLIELEYHLEEVYKAMTDQLDWDNPEGQHLIELEYHLEEVYKAMTDQLDWDNPEGQQYPHNLLQPLPLISDNRGRHVILFEHFINNDLEYLQGGASSQKYTTSVTKTKAADYGHIKWIEDLFYELAINRESALDVYSKRRIIAVTDLKIVEWHNYKHLDWISPEPDGSTQGYPLVSVEVLRYDKKSKSENMRIVPTEMELILKQTQQGISHEVSVTPTKHGPMTKPYSSHCFIANCFIAGHLKMEVERRSLKVKELQERCIKRLSSYQIKKESTFSLSPQTEDHTSDWLRTVLISWLGQTMNACSRVFVGHIYGDRVVSCAGIIGIKHRHKVVRDTIVDICYRSGISAGKEVDIGLDGGRKRGKYMAKCAAIGYGFLPFTFSSLGELETDAVTLLKRIQKFSMAQDIEARAAAHIFNMISFAIIKRVGAQIVSRLPSNLL
nr:hypothetical protein [Tanacetum cinerariifolium]